MNNVKIQKQSRRGVPRKRCSENMQQLCNEINKLQLYWNRTSAWVFCKFASYFQNTFSQEHLWVAASENRLRPNLKMHQNKYDFRNLKMVATSNQTTEKNVS